MKTGLIEKYRQFLPVSPETPVVTLGEGDTPLLYAPSLTALTDGKIEVYLKYEGVNPTGSFKDRGMTLAVSKALEEGSKGVICASTGNTSASAAAYAARAKLPCYVVLPDGKIALGKLVQALLHGAIVIAVEGNFDVALTLVRQIAEEEKITLVNSLNPFRIEGQKTAAFEIIDKLGEAPDYHFIPVGNAGNITAYWKGYKEYREHGKSKRLPRMMGWQAAGAAPIVENRIIESPETVATAIRIGNPASWQLAVNAQHESKGQIGAVSDEEILAAYRFLAANEGVFCEPGSAASVAGFMSLAEAGFFDDKPSGIAVATLTGHGLKDPDIALKQAFEPIHCKADKKEILAAMGLSL